MELSSHEEEAEIPMPINSAFVGVHGNMTHHRYHPHHIHDPSTSSSHNQHNIVFPSNNSNGTTTSTLTTTTTSAVILEDDDRRLQHDELHCTTKDSANNHGNAIHEDNSGAKKMMMVRYRECQKNHAACMGGNATDGCGEFMPSGEEGSIEALTCSACNCHRNFHRKEIQGDQNMMIIPHSHMYPSTPHPHFRGRKVILGGTGVGYRPATGQLVPPFSRSLGINMPAYNQSDEHHHGNNGGGMTILRPNYHHNQVVKKRFRTKFSQEQKEKMLEFADKVGWKIQKQEETVVQQFCQQIGIKRKVLKVWMHNNKHNFAKKSEIDNQQQ